MTSADESKTNKKLLENPFLSSLMVPIAIVLVGALIIFGVSKLLSTDRTYRDLVQEMHSKTFGNRWIAAYELSKQISSSSIPEEEKPWLIENLDNIYSDSKDPRTRDFIIVAMSALNSDLAIPSLEKGLKDISPDVKFHAIVGLGNLKPGVKMDFSKIMKFLTDKDHALQQAAILALSTHRHTPAIKGIANFLNNSSIGLRYSAATGLINFKSELAIDTLKEILALDAMNIQHKHFKQEQIVGLKLNVLSALQRNRWPVLNATIETISKNEKNPKIQSMALDALNVLKN